MSEPRRWVAFLRAINVGRHTVAMEQLRRIFEDLGFANVATFIASGNVIFDDRSVAKSLEEKIEATLERELGYRVATFIRTPSEVASVVEQSPFDGAPGETLYVAFLKQPLTAEVSARVTALQTPVHQLSVSGRHLYWLRREREARPALDGARLERVAGTQMTMRAMTSLQRLAARCR